MTIGQIMKIENVGRISSIEFPDDWVEEFLEQDPFDMSFERDFHLKGDENVRIKFFERGRPLNIRQSALFSQFLEMPEHVVTPREFTTIGFIVREVSDTEMFELEFAKTCQLNGMKVLIAEGRWKHLDTRTTVIFIDQQLDGSTVQELSFTAPTELYDQLEPVAQEILNTIRWRH